MTEAERIIETVKTIENLISIVSESKVDFCEYFFDRHLWSNTYLLEDKSLVDIIYLNGTVIDVQFRIDIEHSKDSVRIRKFFD